MNFLQSTIHSTLDALRDRYAPVSHTSNFRSTGQITPEEFVAAGDFLVYKFPSWSWSDASSPSRRVAYLPDGKQFLITRGVPCHRRLDDNFAGDAGAEDAVIKDGFGGGDSAAAGEDGEDEGWLRTGGGTVEHAKVGDVRTLDGSGNVGENEIMDDEDEIPDMEDEEDEDAIIRDPIDGNNKSPLRTYALYITYTPYYRTPRLYLSGYLSPSEPLPPKDMMQDIVGDYKDKTVTLEDFPFADPSLSLKTASVHPCKHASVMKVLLDRADAALKLRRDRIAAGSSRPTDVTAGMEGLVDDTRNMAISGGSPSQDPGFKAGVAAAGGAGGDEWEVLGNESATAAVVADESAIRVDQYLVVFLKFMAGLMPGIQYDFTTGV